MQLTIWQDQSKQLGQKALKNACIDNKQKWRKKILLVKDSRKWQLQLANNKSEEKKYEVAGCQEGVIRNDKLF